MPQRLLREGILTSERVNALSPGAEVFYRRLMSVVDDFGRFDARPMLLRASCYPLRLDKVSDKDVRGWVGECEKAGLVRVYVVDGKEYLEMLDFRQQVRAKGSKYPDPIIKRTTRAARTPDGCVSHDDRVIEDDHLDGDGDGDGDGDEVVDGDGGGGARPAEPPAPPVVEIPLHDGTTYPVTDEQVREWTGLFPAVDVPQKLREVRAWNLANPARRKTRTGVQRHITAWLAKEQDRGRPQPQERAPQGRALPELPVLEPGRAPPASLREQMRGVR